MNAPAPAFPDFHIFFGQFRPLINREARRRGLDPAGLDGLVWLAWHTARETWQPDRSAATTWAMRQVELALDDEAGREAWRSVSSDILMEDGIEFAALDEGDEPQAWRTAALDEQQEAMVDAAAAGTRAIASRLGVTQRRAQQLIAAQVAAVRSGQMALAF